MRRLTLLGALVALGCGGAPEGPDCCAPTLADLDLPAPTFSRAEPALEPEPAAEPDPEPAPAAPEPAPAAAVTEPEPQLVIDCVTTEGCRQCWDNLRAEHRAAFDAGDAVCSRVDCYIDADCGAPYVCRPDALGEPLTCRLPRLGPSAACPADESYPGVGPACEPGYWCGQQGISGLHCLPVPREATH